MIYRGQSIAQAHACVQQGLSVGEQGDLVIPGLPAHSALARGDRVLSVEGLSGAQSGAVPLGQPVRFVVDAYPDIAVEVERIAKVANPFRRELIRAPLRELRYGMLAALAVASLVTVKVAVSPESPPAIEPDEDSELVQAMLAAPLLEVRPIHLAAKGLAPEPVVDRPATGQRGSGSATTEAKEESEPPPPPLAAKPDPVAEAVATKRTTTKKRKKRGRRKKRKIEERVEADAGVTRVLLGTLGTGEGDVFDVIDAAPSHDLDQLLADVSVGENKPGAAKVVDLTNTVVWEKASPKKDPKPRAKAGAPNRETCEATPDPKSQVDVVFVVDTSDGMSQALAALSTQIRAFDLEVQQYDKNPRYGLVAFVDRVEVRSLTSAAELERELDRLLSRAGMNQQPGGDDRNAEDAENGLDALHAATTEFTWRDENDTLRLVVYASDASAAGRGTALSGAKVEHGYDTVVEALSDASIRVASFTTAPGKSGFSAKRGGRDSIPSQTAGTAFALADLVSHRLPLGTALATLLTNPVCQRGLFE